MVRKTVRKTANRTVRRRSRQIGQLNLFLFRGFVNRESLMETEATLALPIRGAGARTCIRGGVMSTSQTTFGDSDRGTRTGGSTQRRGSQTGTNDIRETVQGRCTRRELNYGNRGTGAGSQDRSKESTTESRYRGTGLGSQLRCHRHSGRQRRFVSVLEFDLRARWTIRPFGGRGFGIGDDESQES